MVLILGDRLIRCTGDGQLNIVAITIVRIADASSSSSAAAADDVSPYPSLNALLGYISSREYHHVNLVIVVLF